MPFRFRTIRWKLITSSLLAIGIPLMVFAYAMASLLWLFYRDNLEKNLRSNAHLVAEACTPALSPKTPDDPGALSRLVNQWKVHTDVRITIVDGRGRIAASSTPDDIGQPVKDERRPGLPEALAGTANSTIWKNPQYGNQDTMYANVPVLENGEIIGAVRVAYTLTQIQEKIAHIRAMLFISVGAYGLLIIVLTVWLAGSIAAPVEALTRDAQRLGRGDLSHRIQVKGTEEINQLAMTLNLMTEQLQHLEGMRRQYVSNVSHELRTPLASIRGMAETLVAHGESDPDLRERYLPRIISQTERLARLATQFLDLALIESGSMVKFLGEVSLASIVSEVVATSGVRAEVEGIALRVDVPENLPPVVADRDRLLQVFINLVDNAIRYTPPGGEVSIRSRLEDEEVCTSVCDTGSGIPPEHLPHLFERFYRVDPARTARSGGTGLGLSIVEQIVAAHGGSINVESEVGRGTCFHVSLPLVPPAAETDHAPAA